MAWFGLKAKDEKKDKVGYTSGESLTEPPHDDQFKAYIPNFLYKPPFGYPLNKNVIQLKNLAKNPYIFSVIKTLKDEASTTKWVVRPKREFGEDLEKEDLKSQVKEISQFFYNPNGNEESFSDILGQWIQDLCEVDAAVGIKVFNKGGEFSQIFARDGGSFLKNPDIYGYIGNRDEFVYPIRDFNPNIITPDRIKVYGANYSESAAYYQYGWTGNALPVPFGRREIMYISVNPRSDSIYGRSPIEVLYDTILTLIYGQQYNLDFYLNGNAPDGMILLQGADQEITEAFQKRMLDKFKITDTLGYDRRIGHRYPVYGGPEAKFIPFNFSASDMEILEQQKWFSKLVWSCFGVTAEQMGYTEHSNKAVSQNQSSVFRAKALRPMLRKIAYAINTQIMTELDPSGRLEFVFLDEEIEEKIQQQNLYKLQIANGTLTSEMAAEPVILSVAFDDNHLKRLSEPNTLALTY